MSGPAGHSLTGRVRLAFVGLGWWSNLLAEAASRSAAIEIAACHSRSGEKTAAFTGRYGGRAVPTFEGLLADPAIDAVVLTTPNSLHAPQAIQAAEHGKHVFVEKPMALSVAECRRMIAAAASGHVVLAVGQNARRMARYRKARELIDQGAIGRVVLAEANSSDDLGMRLAAESWRRSAGEWGGPLSSFTVHHADNFNHLVGPVKRVSAFAGRLRPGEEIDDVVSAAVEFQNGALGYLGGSFITPERNFLQIHGVEGLLLVEQDGGALYYQKRGTTKRMPLFQSDPLGQRADSLAEELDEFADCIRSGRRPEVAGEEGCAAVAVIEAITRSAEAGGPVAVETA